jgi:hypothetical protein
MTPESIAIDHGKLERIARQICESKRGMGAYDKPGCHRNHWRKRALPLAALSDWSIGKTLMQACGWKV